MAKRKKFGAADIGGELLPVITRGLYRDPMDALREYVQNAIDAKAKRVKVSVSADLVSVRDDGTGMTREVAEGGIRLGMSEKNPNKDVGFRGIGVYSAFNICNRLEIYTRANAEDTSKLVFDFGRIRSYLEEEEERRMTGEPSALYLQKLLGESVWVEDCPDCPLEKSGTLVVMVGIRGDVYRRLVNRTDVVRYLESVVPVPFYPRFRHKEQIEGKFEEEDYRVVNLELSIDGRIEKLYRPYRNTIFTHGKGYGPKYFRVKDELGKGDLGFAWVCLNDARKYLPEKALRGLLVKKFGFSVGGREQFARFFSRAVFNNRITGEIIIRNEDLIPNAARTEFEPGHVRDSLYMGFSVLASKISSWANRIQDELKAQEELEVISPRVFGVVKSIPAIERDVEELLRLNNLLGYYEKRLNTYKAKLEKLQKDLLDRTLSALDEGKKAIKDILSAKKERGKGRRERRVKAAKVEAKAPAAKELVHAQDRPQRLLDVVSLTDIEMSKSVRALLEYIDQEVIREKLTEAEYAEFLEDLTEYIEENL